MEVMTPNGVEEVQREESFDDGFCSFRVIVSECSFSDILIREKTLRRLT